MAVKPANVCVSMSSTPMANIRMIGSKSAVRRDGGSRLARWSSWYVLPLDSCTGYVPMLFIACTTPRVQRHFRFLVVVGLGGFAMQLK